MNLVEDGRGLIAYKGFPTESEPGNWSYGRTWPWVLETHVAAIILSAFRPAYAFVYEPAWTSHKQQQLDAMHSDAIDWQVDPPDFLGRNAIVEVETGRLFFPTTRDALEEAAQSVKSGVFIFPESVSQLDIVGLARSIGFDHLSNQLAFKGALARIIAEIFDDLTVWVWDREDEIKECVRLAVALWDDPAAPLRGRAVPPI